jgi:glycosyltransferase involved in cell wall biosynthesis
MTISAIDDRVFWRSGRTKTGARTAITLISSAKAKLLRSYNADPDLEAIRHSRLFDSVFYLKRHEDVAASGMNAAEHFWRHGGFEGRSPHPLFDTRYYLDRHPDVRNAKINPLLHYIRRGENDGWNPCAEFDVGWYRREYGEDARVNGSFLEHFLVNGGVSTSPSVDFDAIRYFAENPDVQRAGVNPLIHYLEHGLVEGRRAAGALTHRSYADAQLLIVKNDLEADMRTAMIVTHAPHGIVKAHVERHVSALSRNDIQVVVIVAADQAQTVIPQSLVNLSAAVVVRENAGYDFAAWAHVMMRLRKVLSAEVLYLINDSIIGPTDLAAFRDMLKKVDANPCDVVGLTENYRAAWHLQSFFLAIKRSALSTYWLHQYFNEIVALPSKDDVIRAYELTFTSRMRAKSISCDSLFGRPTNSDLDETIYQWRRLLDRGMPFVKRSLIDGEHSDKGGEKVVEELAWRGYPVNLIRLGEERQSRDLPKVTAHLRQMGQQFVEEHRASPLSPKMNAQASLSPGDLSVTMIGPSAFANGLGTAARGYVSALFHTDFAYNIKPVVGPFHVHARIAPTWSVVSAPGAPDVAVVHLNPDAWTRLLTEEHRRLMELAARRIGVFVWECSAVPPDWLPALNLLDAVFAPSEYCAAIIRRFTNLPVYVIPHAVEVVQRSALNDDRDREGILLRGRLGIPTTCRVILYAFDGSSFLRRKNPMALARAFKASGLATQGWRLILKTKHLFDVKKEATKLIAEIASDSSIILLNETLSQNDNAMLIDEADIYASPHCSEGFGLTIAEAMARGKLIVASNYGGSRDYLDDTTGFPVAANDVELSEDHGPYTRGGSWAEIDEEELRRALLTAAEEAVLYPCHDITPMGRRAQSRIKTMLSAERIGNLLQSAILEVYQQPQRSDRTRKF